MKLHLNENASPKYIQTVEKIQPSVEQFLNTAEDQITYKLAEDAEAEYLDMYDYVKGLSKQGILDDLETVQGIFYVLYKPFVDKCNSIQERIRKTGYQGVNRYAQLRIDDVCRSVDHRFPYGWKRQGDYVTKYGW